MLTQFDSANLSLRHRMESWRAAVSERLVDVECRLPAAAEFDGSFAVFAAGAVLFVAFVFVERRAAEPVLPLWVLSRRLLLTTGLIALGVGAILIGLTSYVPTYLQGSIAAPPLVAGLALAALTAPMLWLHPVSDGIRFGQVNAFMVLACLLDLREPRPGLLRRVPRGVLVGLAMAVKLTPGVFVVHFLVTRRWREAATAVGTAVAVTLGAWVLLPQASFAFWGGALQDPARLGPNMGTSNQSLRGFLLRVGPDGLAGTAIWLGCVLVVGVLGFRLARRLFLAGDSVGEVAAVGLLACLLSPVAWIHHFHWVVVVVLALLGADPLRDRMRLWAGLAVTAFFLCRLPWWGISWLNHREWPELPGRVLQNADVFGALGALALLWWVTRPPTRPATSSRTTDPDAEGQSTPAISSAV